MVGSSLGLAMARLKASLPIASSIYRLLNDTVNTIARTRLMAAPYG